MAEVDDDEPEALALFQEPEGYFAPEKRPTFTTYTLTTGQTLTLRLVGHNPLWTDLDGQGHLIWNGARVLSSYLQEHVDTLVRDKHVLELGAGAGLPSLVCAVNGAKCVIVTDYPDADLIENLQHNIESNRSLLSQRHSIDAQGYLWGAERPSLASPATQGTEQIHRFDLLILADLLFNHSEHPKLLRSVRKSLSQSRNACALVFFTPYRPWLLGKDLAFFDLVLETGDFVVEKLMEKEMAEVMFSEDPGDERLRRTVFGYSIRWSDAALSKDKSAE